MAWLRNDNNLSYCCFYSSAECTVGKILFWIAIFWLVTAIWYLWHLFKRGQMNEKCILEKKKELEILESAELLLNSYLQERKFNTRIKIAKEMINLFGREKDVISFYIDLYNEEDGKRTSAIASCAGGIGGFISIIPNRKLGKVYFCEGEKSFGWIRAKVFKKVLKKKFRNDFELWIYLGKHVK